jgi:hypothetical protein
MADSSVEAAIAALLGSPAVRTTEQVAERPWQNVGQAEVVVCTAHARDGRSVSLVRKHGTIGKTYKRSRARADDKLASFAAEAAFLRAAVPELAVPAAHLVRHDQASRSFEFLMSDLRADGFTRREVYLGLADTEAALRWLARLHAHYMGHALPEGTWAVGTWWNAGKRCADTTAVRMAAHWRTSRLQVPGLDALPADFGARLFRAAAPVGAALQGGAGARPLRSTLIHGDFKAENLFFTPRGSGGAPACAACDFQWSGGAVGACDLIYLLATSLAPGLLAAHECELLAAYNEALGRELAAAATAAAAPAPSPPSLAELEHEYALATLDFARFVLADGLLVEEGMPCGDAWLAARASQLLARLDGGDARSPAEAYAAALAQQPSVFAGTLSG